MPREFRLTGRALASLVDIAEWTQRRFGHRQAEQYRDRLIGRLDAAAEGRASLRPLSRITHRDEPDGLSVLSEGRHHIILFEDRGTLVVLDIVHQSRDLKSLDFNKKD